MSSGMSSAARTLDFTSGNYDQFCESLTALYVEYAKLGFIGNAQNAGYANKTFEPTLVNEGGNYKFKFFDPTNNQITIDLAHIVGAEKIKALLSSHSKNGLIDAEMTYATWRLPEVQALIETEMHTKLLASLKADQNLKEKIYPQAAGRDLSTIFQLPANFTPPIAADLVAELETLNDVGIDSYVNQVNVMPTAFTASYSQDLANSPNFYTLTSLQQSLGAATTTAAATTFTMPSLTSTTGDRNFAEGSFEQYCSFVAEKMARNAMEGYMGGALSGAQVKTGFEPKISGSNGHYSFSYNDAAGNAHTLDLGQLYGSAKVSAILKSYTTANGEIDPRAAFAIWKIPQVQQLVHDDVYKSVFESISHSAGFKVNVFEKLSNLSIDQIFKIPAGYKTPGSIDLLSELNSINNNGVENYKPAHSAVSAKVLGYTFDTNHLVTSELRVNLSMLMGDTKIRNYDQITYSESDGLVVNKLQTSATGLSSSNTQYTTAIPTPASQFVQQVANTTTLTPMQQAALIAMNNNLQNQGTAPSDNGAGNSGFGNYYSTVTTGGSTNSHPTTPTTTVTATRHFTTETLASGEQVVVYTDTQSAPTSSTGNSSSAGTNSNTGSASDPLAALNIPETNSTKEQLLQQFVDTYYSVYCDRLAKTMATNAQKGFLNTSFNPGNPDINFSGMVWNGSGISYNDSTGAAHKIDLGAIVGADKLRVLNDYVTSRRNPLVLDPKSGMTTGGEEDIKALMAIWELPAVQQIVYDQVYQSVLATAQGSTYFRDNLFKLFGQHDPAQVFQMPSSFQIAEHGTEKNQINQYLTTNTASLYETIETKTYDPKSGGYTTHVEITLKGAYDTKPDYNLYYHQDDFYRSYDTVSLNDIMTGSDLKDPKAIGYDAAHGLYTSQRNLRRYDEDKPSFLDKLVPMVIIAVATWGIASVAAPALVSAAGATAGSFAAGAITGLTSAVISQSLSSALLGTDFNIKGLAISALTGGIQTAYMDTFTGYMTNTMGLNADFSKFIGSAALSAGASVIGGEDWDVKNWFINEIARTAGHNVVGSNIAGTIAGQILGQVIKDELRNDKSGSPTGPSTPTSSGTDPALIGIDVNITGNQTVIVKYEGQEDQISPELQAVIDRIRNTEVVEEKLASGTAMFKKVDDGKKVGLSLLEAQAYTIVQDEVKAKNEVRKIFREDMHREATIEELNLYGKQILDGATVDYVSGVISETDEGLVMSAYAYYAGDVPSAADRAELLAGFANGQLNRDLFLDMMSERYPNPVGVSEPVADPGNQHATAAPVTATPTAAPTTAATTEPVQSNDVLPRDDGAQATAPQPPTAEQIAAARDQQIQEFHQQQLGFQANASTLERYRGMLEQGQPFEAVTALIASDRQFITNLFATHLNREVRDLDYAYWGQAIERFQNRAEIESQFEASFEVTQARQATLSQNREWAYGEASKLTIYDQVAGQPNLTQWKKDGVFYSPSQIEVEEYYRYQADHPAAAPVATGPTAAELWLQQQEANRQQQGGYSGGSRWEQPVVSAEPVAAPTAADMDAWRQNLNNQIAANQPVYQEPVYVPPTPEPAYVPPTPAPTPTPAYSGGSRWEQTPIYEEPVYVPPAAEPAYVPPQPAGPSAEQVASELRATRVAQIQESHQRNLHFNADESTLNKYLGLFDQGYSLQYVENTIYRDRQFISDLFAKYLGRGLNDVDYVYWGQQIERYQDRTQVEELFKAAPEVVQARQALQAQDRAWAYAEAAKLTIYDQVAGMPNLTQWQKEGVFYSPSAIEVEEYYRYQADHPAAAPVATGPSAAELWLQQQEINRQQQGGYSGGSRWEQQPVYNPPPDQAAPQAQAAAVAAPPPAQPAPAPMVSAPEPDSNPVADVQADQDAQIREAYSLILFHEIQPKQLEYYRGLFDQGYNLRMIHESMHYEANYITHEIFGKYMPDKKVTNEDIAYWSSLGGEASREDAQKFMQIVAREGFNYRDVDWLIDYHNDVANAIMGQSIGRGMLRTDIEYWQHLSESFPRVEAAPQPAPTPPPTPAATPAAPTAVDMDAWWASLNASMQQPAPQPAAPQPAAPQPAAPQPAAPQPAAPAAPAYNGGSRWERQAPESAYDSESGGYGSNSTKPIKPAFNFETGEEVAYRPEKHESWDADSASWKTFEKLVPTHVDHGTVQLAAVQNLNLGDHGTNASAHPTFEAPLQGGNHSNVEYLEVAQNGEVLPDSVQPFKHGGHHPMDHSLAAFEAPALTDLPTDPAHKGSHGSGGHGFGETA